MLKKIFVVLLHFMLVSIFIIAIAAGIGISEHASVSFGEAPLAYKVDKEGPYVFFEDDQLSVSYIRGSREDGFYVDKKWYPADEPVQLSSYFPLDKSKFEFKLYPNLAGNPVIYQDNQPILALSDLEGNYKALRDFLKNNGVIDVNLRWVFGQGHLVLAGDMVDRGFSTTQLLWLIYKLEQEANLAGGRVHFIVGNHEIKNMQGNVKSAANKYIPIAGFLGKSSADLLSRDAFLGRWIESKNTVELINGHLFVHGGLHPEIARRNLSLEKVNTLIRNYYRRMYFPGIAGEEVELLISTESGPAWYRGYFHDEISEKELNDILKRFNAKSIIVGHTIQFSVNNNTFDKLFAIDVKHPNDYRASFPTKSSEGLLLDGDKAYRLLDDGERISLSL